MGVRCATALARYIASDATQDPARMLIEISKLLTPEQAGEMARTLEKAEWSDGRETAGYLSSRVKGNEQLSEKHPLALKLGDMLLDRLGRNTQFMSAALPLKIVPPLFNRYRDGQAYGSHVDGGVRPVAGSSARVRTDLSATLFLSDPADYDGGELVVEDTFGTRSIKLNAGDMVLYPGTSVHHVTPVTRGVRIAAFFWIQSMVRGNEQRAQLYELDQVVQRLGGAGSQQHDEALKLAGIYHNLLRFWSDT
jgi:PKHD-type hydroxylase